MTQAERRVYLIDYLLAERGETAEIPKDEYNQKRFLRSLFNVRMPAPIDESFLRVQDEYLQEEVARKGITDIADLLPIQKGIYLWQGDITTLKCGAIVNAANSQMLGCFYPCHGCIDNAIHTYAGVQLRNACDQLMQAQGHEEPTGQAKITPAYNLPYLYALGEDTDNQGKPGYSVTAGENVTLALAGEASKYEVSDITVYENNSGLLYNGTCYAGEDDEVSLTLNHPETPYGRTFSGYTASAGTLNNGVLTMPAEDVTISGEFEFADGVGTRLVGRSISVEGDVGINFYMELDPEIAASETAYIQFTIPTGDKTETKLVPVSKAVKKDGYYVFKCDVAAKEMTSDIKAQVIDPGRDKSGYDYTYSVKEYADALLSHSDGNWEYTKVAPLVKAMPKLRFVTNKR